MRLTLPHTASRRVEKCSAQGLPHRRQAQRLAGQRARRCPCPEDHPSSYGHSRRSAARYDICYASPPGQGGASPGQWTNDRLTTKKDCKFTASSTIGKPPVCSESSPVRLAPVPQSTPGPWRQPARHGAMARLTAEPAAPDGAPGRLADGDGPAGAAAHRPERLHQAPPQRSAEQRSAVSQKVGPASILPEELGDRVLAVLDCDEDQWPFREISPWTSVECHICTACQSP